MILNGCSVRLFVALVSASSCVLWCFLSILGIAESFWKNVVAALAVLSFVVWRIFGARTFANMSRAVGGAARLIRDEKNLKFQEQSSCGYSFRHSNLCSFGGPAICADPSPLICSLIHSRGRLQSFGRLADCWRAAVPAEVPA
jgi:hypothetical protein